MKCHRIIIILFAVLTSISITAKNEERSYNISRALEEAERGNKQGALEYFNKEITDNPKNGLAHLAITYFQIENKEYGPARNAVELALKYIPKKDKSSISQAYLYRGMLKAIECDTVGAYTDLALSIRFDPSNEDALEKRGQLYYEQHRYNESDEDYSKILALNPGGVMGRMGLGRNAFAQKLYDKAIEQFNRIITLNPDYSSGYSFRAEAYIAKADYLNAIDDICKALEIDSNRKALYLLFQFPSKQTPLIITKLKGLSVKYPHTSEYEYYAARVYRKQRMFVESIEALNRAYNIDARAFLLEMIADNYADLGDYTNAISSIRKAIQMEPEDIDLISKLADMLGESGDIDGAIEQWGVYITKNPDYFGGYYRRGFFEDNSNRTEAALDDYNMAIMLDPNYAYSYLGKGDMLIKLNRKDEALLAYQKVVELDTVPNNSSCAMYALLALDRKDEAIAFMEQVLVNDSIDPGNYYDAACFTCRIGDNQKALYYLNLALEKGFRRFSHIRQDDDLSNLRSLDEFEQLLQQYELKTLHQLPVEDNSNDDNANLLLNKIEIPFTPSGGVNKVSCTINGLPLHFIFDTGASTVSLSLLEANFMMKNGFLKSTDVVGARNFYDANGDISEGTIINLRQIDFGGLKLDNVKASVVRNQKAPLLLGQSVLGRLGRIEIDNNEKKIIISPAK